jgi:hypothetical protein
MIPALFTQHFVTICNYNAPIEYSSRIVDLFWIYEEKIILDAIMHLLKLQISKILLMGVEEMHIYIKKDIINDVVMTYGIQKALPF